MPSLPKAQLTERRTRPITDPRVALEISAFLGRVPAKKVGRGTTTKIHYTFARVIRAWFHAHPEMLRAFISWYESLDSTTE